MKIYSDLIYYVDPNYIYRPKNLLSALVNKVCYNGLDTAFPAYIDYQSHWIIDKNGNYLEFNKNNQVELKTILQ